jgi:hypothetical protein
VLPKELEQVRQTTTYFGRIALSTAVSQFPVEEDDYKEVQESVINSLLELRSGQYSTDRVVNQQLARLYKALGRYRSAEEVMTSLIERKEHLGERDDATIVDAYYDRACYQSLRWAIANSEEKPVLVAGIKRDLSRAFSLDETLRAYAQKDKWLQSVASDDWFKDLVRG